MAFAAKSGELLRRLPLLEEQYRRQGRNPEAGGQAKMIIRLEFSNLGPTRELKRELM